MTERQQLEQAIAHLESQRATLGDAVVDASITALQRQLADIKAEPKPAESGERKLVTVMFADISGFMALSEKMDPEAVRDLMNRCFYRLVPCIRRYDGTIDKFIGDEIMALFGAPAAHENDPERALRAALEMQAALDKFNAEQDTQLGIHFGINTGLVLAGGIGSSGQEEYSVMGDAVNLASRLEDASKGGQILVGPDTYRLTMPLFDYQALEPMRVKGREKPVPIYRVLGAKAKPGKLRGLESQGLSSPLIGRDHERAAFTACLERLSAGQGGIVAVIGEAGLGKSRLVAECKGEALTSQLTVGDGAHALPLLWFEGHTLSFGQAISYWPFQEILRQWAGISEDDTEEKAWSKLESPGAGAIPWPSNRLLSIPGNLASPAGTRRVRNEGEIPGRRGDGTADLPHLAAIIRATCAQATIGIGV